MRSLPSIVKLSLLCAITLLLRLEAAQSASPTLQDGAYHVHPGEEIQPALEAAAQDPVNKTVMVHPGTYRPARKGIAMIWLNHRHDGVRLEALGEVVLTAQNPDLADKTSSSFPAVVNHVVYFGDGISRRTLLKGFTITGANNFVTDRPPPTDIEPRFKQLRKTEGFYGSLSFFTDGGAIKIFGRSYPILENLRISDNFSSPCAGGISIEHRGYTHNSVLITNSVFRNNRASVTGSAVDLLTGSAAEIRNCLFVGNISNCDTAYGPVPGNISWPNIPELMATTYGYLPEHGSGALTVFEHSFAIVDRCTFTGNWNGADDRSLKSRYSNSIFWLNTVSGGQRPGKRYELDITRRFGVTNCFINGQINDLQGRIDPSQNRLDCPNPEFDEKLSCRGISPKSAIGRPIRSLIPRLSNRVRCVHRNAF